jgi:hypothetical protein
LAGGEAAQKYLLSSFPSWLEAHAKATLTAGGRVQFSKMGWLDSLLIRKVGSVSEDMNTISVDEINKFVKILNQE